MFVAFLLLLLSVCNGFIFGSLFSCNESNGWCVSFARQLIRRTNPCCLLKLQVILCHPQNSSAYETRLSHPISEQQKALFRPVCSHDIPYDCASLTMHLECRSYEIICCHARGRMAALEACAQSGMSLNGLRTSMDIRLFLMFAYQLDNFYMQT